MPQNPTASCADVCRLLYFYMYGRLMSGYALAGRAAGEVLQDFPDLEPEDIRAALEYAAAAVQERELPLAAG
jgi:hypothetical protein